MRQAISALEPDIVCLTEAYSGFLTDGHAIEAMADYGYPLIAGRRKVLLWSKLPWADEDRVGSTQLPTGRFVRGRTLTPIGDIDVIGVCIPWARAHVSSGRRDRTPWQDHVEYLNGLQSILDAAPKSTVLVGDYNQRVPRRTAPPSAFDALQAAALFRLNLSTAGTVEPAGVQLIDHVAHSPDLLTAEVRSISNLSPDGRAITDHIGAFVRLERVIQT